MTAAQAEPWLKPQYGVRAHRVMWVERHGESEPVARCNKWLSLSELRGAQPTLWGEEDENVRCKRCRSLVERDATPPTK